MPNSRTSDTFHLNEEDLSRLVRERDRVARHLDKVGFTNAEIQAALHYNPTDISERRSAACPYEQERARRLVLHHFRGRAGDAYLVTAGNPCLRTPLDNIDDIDVAAALRPFRTACERLAAVGERVRGFAVFELHACYLTEGEPFLEPHFHAVLWGPSKDALKEAFMHLLPVTEVLKPLASKLPQGRIFGSGRAFVPFVSRKLYAALTEHLPRTTPDLRVVASSSPTPAADDKAGRDEAKNKPFDPELPKDWAAVKPGSLVLAREGERGEGWYEAVVVASKGTDVFELRWLDYPDEPNIVRHRTRVALMFPGAVVDAA